MDSVFKTLNSINVNDHTEQKSGLTFLSWAWAWAEVKKAYPSATYTVYENSEGWNYFTDGRTAWVKTGVTIEGTEHIEYLPIMDFKNKSLPIDKITSFDVNKSIQRSLTKACARHGLGLYIYAGEDLPEATIGFDANSSQEEVDATKKELDRMKKKAALKCADCDNEITDYVNKDNIRTSAKKIAEHSMNSYGKCLCYECAVKLSRKKAVKNG